MNEKLKGGILVFAGAASFGFLSTIVKFAYRNGYTLGEITGSQAFFGMVILWLLYFVFSRKKNRLIGKANPEKFRTTPWWKVSFAGIFTGLVGIFYYQCVKLLPASVAIILLMQYLWITMLIELVVFRKKPGSKQLWLLVFVLLGTVLAAGILNQKVEINLEGILYGLLAAFCYAIFLMTSGKVGNELPVLKKSALMITGSCIANWIIFPPLYLFNGVMMGGLYGWGILLAVLGTVIPPLFFSKGIPKTGIPVGSILSAAELPVATLSSAFILHETVGLTRWIGVALILAAIVCSNFPVKPKPEKS